MFLSLVPNPHFFPIRPVGFIAFFHSVVTSRNAYVES